MSQNRTSAKTDLHLHSPAGGDYRGDPATTPVQIVAGCARAKLELVVIVDHMTTEAWRHFAPLCGDGTQAPFLLPGAEVKVRSAQGEIHFVAIFDADRAAVDFPELLRVLMPYVRKNGSLSTTEIGADPDFVANAIREVGALCMAAHVDREGTASEQPRLLEAVSALADADLIDAMEFDDPALAMTVADRVRVPCVTSSDGHSLDEIGRRHTDLVISELSFEGLREALSSGSDAVLAVRSNATADALTAR